MEIIYFLLIIMLFIEINSELINNPQLIGTGKYPFLLSTPSDDYNYLIIDLNGFKLNKKKGSVEKIYVTERYHNFFIYLNFSSHNNYLFDREINIYYKINYEPSISFEKLFNITELPYVDCSYYSPRGSMEQNDNIIFYGLSSNNNQAIIISFRIFFYINFMN